MLRGLLTTFRARNQEAAPAQKGNQAQELPRTDKPGGCGMLGRPAPFPEGQSPTGS